MRVKRCQKVAKSGQICQKVTKNGQNLSSGGAGPLESTKTRQKLTFGGGHRARGSKEGQNRPKMGSNLGEKTPYNPWNPGKNSAQKGGPPKSDQIWGVAPLRGRFRPILTDSDRFWSILARLRSKTTVFRGLRSKTTPNVCCRAPFEPTLAFGGRSEQIGVENDLRTSFGGQKVSKSGQIWPNLSKSDQKWSKGAI